MSTVRIYRYEGDGVVVTFEARRCIHSEECVHGAPAVFDSKRKPWVDAKAVAPDAVARVIERCPSGALQYERKDGAPQEAPAAKNSIRIAADGPHYLRGRIRIDGPDGEAILRDTRVALCRCGKSLIKPFCDNSHVKAGFRDPGLVAKPEEVATEDGKSREGALVVECTANGPLSVSGDFELIDAAGKVAAKGNVAWLCRCGGSANKPFCDGTHEKIGFKS